MTRDPVYALDGENVDVFLFDQNMGRDEHVWTSCNGTWGKFQDLFKALVPRWRVLPMMKSFETVCYERVVFGHELMLYSGASGSWVNSQHVQAFSAHVRTMWTEAADPRNIVLIQRWPPAWGRRIVNIEEVEWRLKQIGVVNDVPFWGVVDFAELSMKEQIQVARQTRILIGAHGDGLSWGIFMDPGKSVMLEAVPGRAKGYEVCTEGENVNPGGIFGGLCRLAGIGHACWANPVEDQIIDDGDPWQWNWRKLNIVMDLDKLQHFLLKAIART